jgi:lysophospholipase L1-like esterase
MRACLAAVLVASIAAMTATGASASVLVVGDSLGVGTEPSLRAALGGVAIEADNQNGRTSAQGMAVLRERLGPEHDTVVLDLGTNDGPTAVAVTAANLATARDLVDGRCLVVATLNHPPVGGTAIGAQNASIRNFVLETPGAVLVDWRLAARSTPGSLGSDGVHATSAGYALRGALFAEAVTSCLGPRSGGAVSSRASGPAASSTRQPADRAAPKREPLGMVVRDRLLGLLVAGLTFRGGPGDLAEQAAAVVQRAGAEAHTALTPRGPEPILGAPQRPL